MSCNVFINFNGNCRDALAFYQSVFRLDAPEIMTYGSAPDAPQNEDSDRVLYAMLPIAGSNMMFSDCPASFDHVCGNNIAITLGLSDADEINRVFAELSEGGTVFMPPGKTFFSDLFCMFADKFGITWQLS